MSSALPAISESEPLNQPVRITGLQALRWGARLTQLAKRIVQTVLEQRDGRPMTWITEINIDAMTLVYADDGRPVLGPPDDEEAETLLLVAPPMTPDIIRLDGLYWPASDTKAREVILRDCAPAIEALLPHIEGRDCIVQAGANVGVYPIALTDHFGLVVTAEPDPTNWACLTLNLAAHANDRTMRAIHIAFGAEPGQCVPVEVHPHNCGANRVSFVDQGPVLVNTIDSLGLDACDCIWLDVEGSELFALQGAEKTVERFSPTIAVEDKGLDAQFFGIEPGSLQKWMAERGYVQVDRIGQDKIFRRSAK